MRIIIKNHIIYDIHSETRGSEGADVTLYYADDEKLGQTSTIGGVLYKRFKVQRRSLPPRLSKKKYVGF